MLLKDTQNERDDSKTKLKLLKSRCDELSKSTPLKCALCPQSDLGILNTFADLIRNAKQAVFLSVPFWLHDVIGNAILGLSDGTLIFFSRFHYVTQITRISLVSFTHTARKSLENQLDYGEH